jgi:hypothetical protein
LAHLPVQPDVVQSLPVHATNLYSYCLDSLCLSDIRACVTRGCMTMSEFVSLEFRLSGPEFKCVQQLRRVEGVVELGP